MQRGEVSVWVVVCGVQTKLSEDGDCVVLNYDVSVLLSQWVFSLLMMTTEAVPLANFTSALDLRVDFQLACRVNTSLGARGGACGMVKTAEKKLMDLSRSFLI